MKLLGLIGGTSYLSTAEYYTGINAAVNQRLGGQEFARCLVYSLNFADFRRLNEAGDMAASAALFIDAAKRLQAGGAEAIVLCANGIHRFADDVAAAVPLPLLHIADATAAAIREQGFQRVALLGIKPTMTETFIVSRLGKTEVLIPSVSDRDWVHKTILDELTQGRFTEETRSAYIGLIASLADQGAEAVVLGCTEIPMLLGDTEAAVPTLDTMKLHIAAAADYVVSS